MAEKSNIRVRLAPSPTGEVHIGTIWVALFDWLFARQQHGAFVVRIEDTDQKRLVQGAVDRLYEALDWYGLTPDEGPNHGGDFGPYVQSQRLDLYKKYAEQLIQQGSAYYCFCTPERLTELRDQQQAAKQPPRYDKRCAALSPDEVARRQLAGESAVVRLNVPASGSVTVNDLIRGQVTFRFDQVDDSVLLKSDGFPTYHLAVVVDDHLMEISHVIRAEEWLSSTPKHLLLYQMLGWTPPVFAHLPQILGPNKKKLSKREGAASALWFRDQGYLPEAMINFLGLMGWHPKGDSEIVSRQDLVDQFRLEEVHPSGAVFDQTKLDWLNGYYIRQLSLEQLFERIKPFWNIPTIRTPSEEWLLRALALVHDRLKKLGEINDVINFAFDSVWDDMIKTKDAHELFNAETHNALVWAEKELQTYSEPWVAGDMKQSMLQVIKDSGKKNGQVLPHLRKALSLSQASPDVFDILALLGKKESLRRVTTVLKLE